MTKVYFTSKKEDLLEGLNQLTPGNLGKWGSVERVDNVEEADFIVVLEDSVLDLSTVDLDKVIAFPLDPKLRKNYLKYNFPHRYTWGTKGKGRVLCTLPGKTYDELKAMERPTKTKCLSCIVYENINLYTLSWLRKYAKTHYVDIYGYDFEIEGQSQYQGPASPKAFEEYQYSIVFEDIRMENYFTEKLTDCLLSWCFPLYWGCPNILDILPEGIKAWEKEDPGISLARSHNRPVEYSNYWGVLHKARQNLLDQLNLWAQVEKISVKERKVSRPDLKGMDQKGLDLKGIISEGKAPEKNPFENLPPEKTFEDMNVAKDGICLVMIVRDEHRVIERALKSVVGIISSYLICDTGSLDNTPQIIENFMESHGIPGQVIYKKWKNFGYNKSYLLKRAYEDNLALGAKYLIWLDADEVFLTYPERKSLTVEDGKRLLDFANSRPEMGVFMFMTHYGGLEYQRWQMVRNTQLYQWRCPVHEYLHHTEPTGTILVDFLIILARKEGARTIAGDSSQRDIQMFEEYLEEHPTCSRSTFYLAQTLGESGQLERAIEMYTKRLTMPGFYQEKYIAALRMGHHYSNLGQKEKALEVWGKHWAIVPTRLEIPYYHMMLLRNLKRTDEAYSVGARAYEIHQCRMSDLFVEKGIYSWRFYLEFSVIAFYSQHYQMAYQVGKRLLSEGKYPNNQAKVVEQNMSFFSKKVPLPDRGVPQTLSRQFNFHPPAIIVVDDFFPHPDEVRKFGLSQEFTVTGNYPGRRTKSFATLDHKEAFERILGKKITYWPDQYNGSFQYTFGSHKSWIHRDLTDFSAIIYLTPDPPAEGGTLVYRHKKLGIEKDSEAKDKDQIKQMNDDSNDESKWEAMDTIANKYNRLIIFTGRRSHKSNKYFGSTKESARLFQTFFFNVEGYH